MVTYFYASYDSYTNGLAGLLCSNLDQTTNIPHFTNLCKSKGIEIPVKNSETHDTSVSMYLLGYQEDS